MAGHAVSRRYDAGLPDASEAGTEALVLRLRRLELDIEDLGFENARLKGSIGEKQDEIMALSDRLGQMQLLLEARQRGKVWGRLRRLLRAMLRRLR